MTNFAGHQPRRRGTCARTAPCAGRAQRRKSSAARASAPQSCRGRTRSASRSAGKTFTQPLRVEPDPRARYTPADYRAAYAFAKKHLEEYSALNAALNRLDAYAASAPQRAQGAPDALATALTAVRTKALALRSELTADFTNDEDFIQRPGRLREDFGGLLFAAGAPPSAATLDYAARVDRAYAAAMARCRGVRAR